jgi:hypothetical protein
LTWLAGRSVQAAITAQVTHSFDNPAAENGYDLTALSAQLRTHAALRASVTAAIEKSNVFSPAQRRTILTVGAAAGTTISQYLEDFDPSAPEPAAAVDAPDAAVDAALPAVLPDAVGVPPAPPPEPPSGDEHEAVDAAAHS